MKILITGKNEFSGSDLDIGREYLVEPADTGTLAQNSLFHSLCQEFWRSGLHSYQAMSFKEFKDQIKRDYGMGYESYVYVETTEDGFVKGKAKSMADVPENLARDKHGNRMVWGILKSWSDYSKKQRMETIDRLIATMIQVGINSRKFHEILDGLEERKAG